MECDKAYCEKMGVIIPDECIEFKCAYYLKNQSENKLDLMRDEFVRIAALDDATDEIKGICQRAITYIEQHVPVVVQRDEAIKDLMESKRRLEALQSDIENHPEFENFIRAFWRRIYIYRNDFGKELPKDVPVQFRASMATAFIQLRRCQAQ